VGDLALEVGEFDPVIIDDADGANPARREIEQQRATKSARADDQDTGAPPISASRMCRE
jgi:hypothetical protein